MLSLEKTNLDTPALIVDLEKMERNIRDMAESAKDAGVALRPHVKTHKVPEIAHIQLKAGASGICVQKLGEAEVMAAGGLKDIFITYQMVGERKIRRLTSLAKDIDISVLVDDLENARCLSSIALDEGVELNVFVEIDSGHGRCGVLPGERAVTFANKLSRLKGIRFKGLMTYEGIVYRAKTLEERERMTREAIGLVLSTAEMIRSSGISVPVVSVGSTPSAKIVGRIPGVTEMQPGNYVFYDIMQVERGVVDLDACALTVLATVISRPTPDRLVVDVGSKAFSNDQGVYPHLLGVDGAKVAFMTEEHGVLKLDQPSPTPRVGDKLEFVPYHACTCVNMHDQLIGVRRGRVEATWKIAARGKMQ